MDDYMMWREKDQSWLLAAVLKAKKSHWVEMEQRYHPACWEYLSTTFGVDTGA
jgi:hypothetical protein